MLLAVSIPLFLTHWDLDDYLHYYARTEYKAICVRLVCPYFDLCSEMVALISYLGQLPEVEGFLLFYCREV